MKLLKDLEVYDTVLVNEHDVPTKYLVAKKDAEYITECRTIEFGIALIRVEPVAGPIPRYPVLIVAKDGTWIDDSGILHGESEDE